MRVKSKRWQEKRAGGVRQKDRHEWDGEKIEQINPTKRQGLE